MKNKSFYSVLLAAVMLLALAACGSSAAAPAPATASPAAPATAEAAAPTATAAPTESPAAEEELPLSDTDVQLALIYSQIDSLEQRAGELPWYYTVTDLDHDGNLEFIAASQHPQDRSTNLKIWEVNPDRVSLSECVVNKDAEESFPDIMTDSCDTYYDAASNMYYYMFYDNVVISPTDVYTSKSSFYLKNGAISYEAYAVEHAVVQNGVRVVSHTDAQGNDIIPAVYNASGDSAFIGAQKSSTSFEWMTAAEFKDLRRLTESFSVFSGRRAPTESFPVPMPDALRYPEATPSPTPTATPQVTATPTATPTAAPVYLSITKNPTDENNRTVGGTATFVACANAYESLAWTFVDSAGNHYTPQQVADMFGTTVNGVYSSTLSITVTPNLNNFGVFCTFYYKNQTARTSTAYIRIKDAPAPSGGETEGRVVDWNYAYVSLRAEGMSMTASWDVVDLEGDIYEDAPAKIQWETLADGNRVSYCKITGRQPEPQPEYGSMSGTVYSDTAETVFVVLDDGTQLHVPGLLCEIKEGSVINNAPCVVYYTGTPTEQSVYHIDIFGYDVEPEEQPDPQPSVSYYSVKGTVYHDTAFTVFVRLENGTELTLESAKIEINIKGGSEIEGAPCVVYYTDGLSADSVYKLEINGYDPAPVMIESAATPEPVMIESAATPEPVSTPEPQDAPEAEGGQGSEG